ncbi:copper resistance CopC family protein [Cellulomonas soli]|uniref:CopC domain-containing protein n=1 Tax=Cellulomonas soli TaxID=931535 RepID=A0A512PET5_9CELL|nr:copper resistance CopC family protein [Cellulomonas soli]NYI59488.1 hypothetical protein [Cellulomonas soli]GEP69720.1 hypothetical protein CSO01_24350 [Cellulomonas soli]
MPVLRRVLSTLLVGGLLAAGSLGAATNASAHDQLLSTSPADGEVVTTAPTALTLEFSDDVLDLSSAVVLTPAGGTAVELAVTVDGPTVTAALPADLPSGAYAVAWRVVSADGHPIEGTFAYTVDDPARPAAVATPTPTPTPTPTATPTPEASPSDTTTATVAATLSPGSSTTQPSEAPGPAWIALGLGLVVAAATAVVVLLRRRGRPTP